MRTVVAGDVVTQHVATATTGKNQPISSQRITQVLKDSSNNCHGWSKYQDNENIVFSDQDSDEDDRLVIDLDTSQDRLLPPAAADSSLSHPGSAPVVAQAKMSAANNQVKSDQHEATVDKGLKMKIKRKTNMHGSGSANKQQAAQDSSTGSSVVAMGKGSGNSMNQSETENNTPTNSPTGGSSSSNQATMPGPFEKLKAAILENQRDNKAGAKNAKAGGVHPKKEHPKKGGSPLGGGNVSLGSPSGNPSGITVNGVQDTDRGMGPFSGQKRDLADPYEFNVKVEDSRSMGFPVGKKLKVEKHDGEMQRDMGTDTNDVSVITEPDLMGPCEPGTSVTLEGIVWQETENGMLIVNITWRGKTYVGTLLDATKHEWAPPSFRSESPQDAETRTSGRGRGGKRGRQTMNSMGGRGRSTRSSAANNNVFAIPASPIKTENLGKRRAAAQAAEEVPPAKRTRSGSATPGGLTAADLEEGYKVGEDNLIECPEPGCGKKYRHINGLKYHQSHAHKDVMLRLQNGDSATMDVDESSNQGGSASKDSKDNVNSESANDQIKSEKKEKKKKNRDGKKKKGKKNAEHQQQQSHGEDEDSKNSVVSVKQEDNSKSVSFKQPTVQLTPVSMANKTVTAPIATVPVGSAIPPSEHKSKKSKDKSDKKSGSLPKSSNSSPNGKSAVIGESDNLKEQREKKPKKKKKDKNRDKHSHDGEKSDSKSEKDKDKSVDSSSKPVSENSSTNPAVNSSSSNSSSVIKSAPNSGLPQPVTERSNSADSQPINLSKNSNEGGDKLAPSSQTPSKQSPLKVEPVTPEKPIRAPESVQSPAYSDISDDGNESVPSLDNELEKKEGGDVSSNLQKVVVGHPGAPGPLGAPTGLQYPSQPPSLTPVFSQGGHPHKPADYRTHSIINLTKDKKEGENKDGKEGAKTDTKPPGSSSSSGQAPPPAGMGQYPYSSYPYGGADHMHLQHLMATNPQARAQHEKYLEEQKRKAMEQLQQQQKKPEPAPESRHGADHPKRPASGGDPQQAAHRSDMKAPGHQHSPGVRPQRPDSRERKVDGKHGENPSQLLKENLEREERRGPVPDSPEARAAYEQRMRMMMYQQQQQQHYQRLMEQQKSGGAPHPAGDKKPEAAAGAPPRSEPGSLSSPKPRGHPQEEPLSLSKRDSTPSTPTGPPKPVDGRRPEERLRDDHSRGSPSPRNTPTPSKDASVPRSIPTSAASPYGHPYYGYPGLAGHPAAAAAAMGYPPGMNPFMQYPGSPYMPPGAPAPREGQALELLQQHASQYYNRDSAGRPGEPPKERPREDKPSPAGPSREQLERADRERAIAHAREMEQRGSPSSRHLPPTSMMSPHSYPHAAAAMYAAHYPGGMMSSPQAAARMGPPK